MATVHLVGTYAALKTALEGAQDGDTVRLTATTYTGNHTSITTFANITVDLEAGVSAATINLTTEDIIIQGQIGGTTQTWSGDISITTTGLFGKSLAIDQTSGVGPVTASFDGMTFQADLDYCAFIDAKNSFDAEITFTNCTFNGNSASTAGAGLFNAGSTNDFIKSKATFNTCTFATQPLIDFESSDYTSANFTNCTFTSPAITSVFNVGGNSVVTCTGSTITYSAAVTAIITKSSANCTFTNCTLSATGNAKVFETSTASEAITFTNCTISNTSSSSKIMFDAGNIALFTIRGCTITNVSTAQCFNLTGTTELDMFDTKITQTGDLVGLSVIDANADTVDITRSIIDASGSTGTDTVYVIDLTGSTNSRIRGNVIINPENRTGQSGSILAPSGIGLNIFHNTFIRYGSQAAANDGLFLNTDGAVRGNIFSGFDKALIPGGTSDYFYNTGSGYNVFHNNTTDIEGSIDAHATDKLGVTYDLFLDFINKDFRLQLGTPADNLDPNDALQIDYHQLSTDTRGNGSITQTLVPDIEALDKGPTDAGAYNNQGISYQVTLQASPDSGWFFGRFQGDQQLSMDNPFVFTMTSSQFVTAYFYSHVAPHITSPKGGEIFNLGKIPITWNPNAPKAVFNSTSLSYDIEYTDDYKERDTNWYTLKRRIPWNTETFEWVAGKSIKSRTVRIRMRSRSIDGNVSDWSMIGGDFCINVFKLIPPAIVGPLANHVYTDFILIILDESQLKDTFNQKVRYTLEYMSDKRSISYTAIAKDVPVGQNVIKWDLEGLPPSDDYILRLTAKNSCLQPGTTTPDQIARRFVYNLKIQQPGMFLIDTIPPQAVLELENEKGITNQLIQTVNIFAEDATTDVKQIQLRECDTSNQLALGDVSNPDLGTTECSSVEEILNDSVDFNTIIGKPLGYSTKTQWTFKDTSGNRQLEAMLTDSGGNTSLQNSTRVFIPVFRSDETINDFIVVSEQREDLPTGVDDSGLIITTEVATFEVGYVGTKSGQYWVLEPFPRLVDTLDREIFLLFQYINNVYIFTYANTKTIPDQGSVYVDQKTQLKLLFNFNEASLPKPNAVAEFMDVMYVGLENGELWSYNGVIFSMVRNLGSPIRSLHGDESFLYIGLSNNSTVSLYDGLQFFDSDTEQ